ncbi:polysaccharide pyruvyl transferase family protein [Halobacillus litoralis]|uniref:polysaccharide pyruvyl transferase family protein n=1 Tax=Halobacillus litoralis TaxID=45668 RepID=UPI00136829B9|nr:polysaccharide pyruvyl transferase family protein [Halobacillus litoralis]
MRKVLIRGYYGFNNFGDDALLYTILKKVCKKTDIVTVLSKKEIPLSNTLNREVKFVSTSKFNIISQVIINDIFVFGGGSQFQDFGTKNNVKELLFKLGLIVLAKITGSKVIHLGISIGPLKTRIGKLLTKLSFKFSDSIGVRDERSLNYLNTMLRDERDYFLTPDLTLMLHDGEVQKKIKEVNIGVNVIPYDKTTKNSRENKELLFNNLWLAMKEIKSNQPNITFTFFAFQEDENVSDRLELIKLADEDTEIITYTGSIEKFENEINNCSHFITMRFHAAVFSYINNIPQFNLSYHQKCIDFMEKCGYGSDGFYDIRYQVPTKKELQNRIQKLISNDKQYYVKSDNNDIISSFNDIYRYHF